MLFLLLVFNLKKNVLKFNDICMSCSSKKTDKETNFLGSKNRSFEGVRKNVSEKVTLSPRKKNPWKLIPQNCPLLPGKMSPRKMSPAKLFYWFFVVVDIILHLTVVHFFSINMNYTLNRKFNKYSSPFDICLTK